MLAALQADLLPSWLSPALAERLLLALVGLLAIWAAARLLRRSLPRWIEDPAVQYRARKVVDALALVAGLVFVVLVLLDRLVGLGVTLGLVGAGVALAIQPPLLSVVGWMALASGRYYRTGHRVQVGDVSGDFPFLWDGIEVPIRHGGDRDAARELLKTAVREITGTEADEARATWRDLRRKYRLSEAAVDPTVRMVADENWLTFSVRYVVDYRRGRAVKDTLWSRVLDAVDAADGVELAATSQEITVTPDSSLTVREGP